MINHSGKPSEFFALKQISINHNQRLTVPFDGMISGVHRAAGRRRNYMRIGGMGWLIAGAIAVIVALFVIGYLLMRRACRGY